VTDDLFDDAPAQPGTAVDHVNTQIDDLFDDAPAAPEYGVRAGRYRFPPPPGVTPSSNGWMRMTNLVSAFSDQRALQLWLERMTLLGLLADDGVIFDEMAATPDSELTSGLLEEFAEKARMSAGATGGRHGTARHRLLEHYLDTGQIGGHRRMRLQMEDLLVELDRHDLEFIPGSQERVVWHPIAGGTAGRMDAKVLCRRTGEVGVLDLKTQRRFWTYQEIAGQQCGYDSAAWIWEGPAGPQGRWTMNETGTLKGRPGGMCEGKRVAILAHMPSDGGRVQLHEVDLEYGAQVLEVAAWVVALRGRGKSVKPGRGVGGLRPLHSSAIVEA
jgi:hypothetical protein